MPQERTKPPSSRFIPCLACERVAGALVDFVHHFGARVAKSAPGSFRERICPAHLGLVVGFTAPLQLAKWLREVLAERDRDPGGFDNRACPLCEIELRQSPNSSSGAAGPFACPEHGGAADRGFAELLDALDRLAAGETLDDAEERRLLRTALVQYASLRATSAFLPRIE